MSYLKTFEIKNIVNFCKLFNFIVGSNLSAGLVVSEFLPTTPIRFKKLKDYTKIRNTECVELVFSSPSKDTKSDISDIIDMPSPTPKRIQNYNIDIYS